MAHLALPSRLLPTVLLFVATLGCVPAAAADGLPRSFSVPALQQGDAWTYAVAGPDGLLQHAFEQQGPSSAHAADGTAVATARLVDVQTWQEGDRQVVHHWSYDVAADGTAVAATHLRKGPGSQATNTISGLPAGLDDIVQSDAEYPIVATTTSGPEPACGHRSSLQGATVRLAGGATLHGCPGDGRFLAVGVAPFGGQQAVVLGLAAAPEAYQVWFTPDRPVPVRIVDRRAEAPTVLELAGFAAGQGGPLAYGGPGTDLPALDVVPRPVHGLDEAGTTHPFPLATAFAAALADAEFAAVIARTGGYVQAASYVDLLDNRHTHQERTRSWTLTASDGVDAVAVTVTVSNLEGPAASPLPVATPPAEPSIASAAPGEGPWPRAHLVPSHAPSVASLLARWRAAAPDGDANAWGFRIQCAGEACAGATFEAWAGHDQHTQPNDPEVGLAIATIRHRDASLLAGDALGRTAWSETVAFGSETRLTGVPLVGDAPAQAPAPLAFVAGGAAEALPWAGIAAAATAAGLAALLVAWLAKAGPFAGLFSRHIPDLTAHPVRRAIVDAIAAQPGIHHSELLRRVGKGNSVVTNHLRRLLAGGLVVERRGPRYRCYFPAGAERASLTAGPLVKSEVAQGILRAVATTPCSGQELAARLGVEPSAITYHVQRLDQAGLVATRRSGRFVLVETKETGRRAAAAGLPT